MGRRRISTSNVTQADRDRLGAAVRAARSEAGFPDQKSFAAQVEISRRSLQLVEAGQPGVGQGTLFKLGSGLSRYFLDWTIDTAVEVLTGAPAPQLRRRYDQGQSPTDWALAATDEEVLKVYRQVRAVSGAALAEQFLDDVRTVRRRASSGSPSPDVADAG